MENTYSTVPIVNRGELPDPFTRPDGTRVATREEWFALGRTWRDRIVDMEYGGMPPAPDEIRVETLCHHTMRSWEGKPRNWSYRVNCHGGKEKIAIGVRVMAPAGDGPFPAVICGDECWKGVGDEIAQKIIRSGYALVRFNRTELAEDLGYYKNPEEADRRTGGLWDVYGKSFGALCAWAWGYHRCVDMLERLDYIDTDRIAVTGHSRGGKTALLAGATDERIALVNDNGSCAGGSAAFRYVGAGGETINIVNVFPSWFNRDMAKYVNREDELPFDQHCLLASIAPRPLLLTYALDDRWSNPEGMVQAATAAREVYEFLGAPDGIAFHLREGGHSHSREDWDVLLDFMNVYWKGGKPTAAYNEHPYAHMQPAFSWRRPG